MAYVLSQYNKNKTVHDDGDYMTLITQGRNDRKQAASSTGIIGADDQPFVNECCVIENDTKLEIYKNYYFHGKIKRLLSDQIFYVKLVNFDDTAQSIEQYIKTITIQAGNIHDWVDIEFTFTPMATFDCILFELKRDIIDYKEETRFPIIAYEELSQIENLITKKIKASGVNLLKIGVQSHPGLMMCINGEEIRIPRTGIYELKNGIIVVSFFSVLAAAKEETTILEDWISDVNNRIDEGESPENIGSNCFFATTKNRTIDSFTLDYMYMEETS